MSIIAKNPIKIYPCGVIKHINQGSHHTKDTIISEFIDNALDNDAHSLNSIETNKCMLIANDGDPIDNDTAKRLISIGKSKEDPEKQGSFGIGAKTSSCFGKNVIFFSKGKINKKIDFQDWKMGAIFHESNKEINCYGYGNCCSEMSESLNRLVSSHKNLQKMNTFFIFNNEDIKTDEDIQKQIDYLIKDIKNKNFIKSDSIDYDKIIKKYSEKKLSIFHNCEIKEPVENIWNKDNNKDKNYAEYKWDLFYINKNEDKLVDMPKSDNKLNSNLIWYCCEEKKYLKSTLDKKKINTTKDWTLTKSKNLFNEIKLSVNKFKNKHLEKILTLRIKSALGAHFNLSIYMNKIHITDMKISNRNELALVESRIDISPRYKNLIGAGGNKSIITDDTKIINSCKSIFLAFSPMVINKYYENSGETVETMKNMVHYRKHGLTYDDYKKKLGISSSGIISKLFKKEKKGNNIKQEENVEKKGNNIKQEENVEKKGNNIKQEENVDKKGNNIKQEENVDKKGNNIKQEENVEKKGNNIKQEENVEKKGNNIKQEENVEKKGNNIKQAVVFEEYTEITKEIFLKQFKNDITKVPINKLKDFIYEIKIILNQFSN